MTIEDFKSYVLTLTDNKAFNLKHMIGNEKTLGDLVIKTGGASEKIEVCEKDYSKEYFILEITDKSNGKVHSIDKLYPGKKLSSFIEKIEKVITVDKTKFLDLTFADGTDV